jgi:hypothetical protein
MRAAAEESDESDDENDEFQNLDDEEEDNDEDFDDNVDGNQGANSHKKYSRSSYIPKKDTCLFRLMVQEYETKWKTPFF